METGLLPRPRLVIGYATHDSQIFEKLKGYFDLLINTLSVEIGWNHYLNLLALDGRMVVVGLPEKKSRLVQPHSLMLGEVLHAL